MSQTHVTDYDIVFALHTGVTIMMQRQSAFDGSSDSEVPFTLSPPEDGEIHITPPAHGDLVIKNVAKNMMAEILQRGFFMVYELDGDEIARCTPCALTR